MRKICRILLVINVFLASQLNHASTRAPKLVFENISMAAGMPSSTIGDMFQDQLGFLWIGTKNGLVRYDGHNIVVFQHDSTNVHSIGHNFIIQICGDSQGNLWLLLGDRKGIDKYDSKTQKFYHFSHDPDNPESLDNDIVQMYMDQYDQLWIISVEKTLDKLDTTTGAIKHFSNTSSREKPNEIGDVFNLWLGYQHLIAISEDNARNLWIGTNGHGVARYNRDATSFSMYQHNPDDPQSISCDSVSFIFQDSDSILWFCTWGGGLNRYSLETNTHTHFRNDPDNPSSLGNDYCYFIYEDRFKNLWISYFGGLDCFNKENNIFTHYPGSSPNKPSFLDSWQLSFLPIYEDHEGMLWIIKTGSEYQFQLIERYDPHTGNSYIYKEDCNDPNAHRISHFTCFLQDQSGNFWMGSEYHGLTKFNPLIQSFRHYAFDAGDIHSLSHNTVNAIVESKINPGVMWLATKDGLNRYNPHLDSFARYYHDPKNPNSPSSSEFRAILADKDGLIWLGTKGGELDYYDERKKKFYHINYSPEFSQRSHIEAIFRHIDGSLWISECNRGILKYKSIDGPRERFRTEQHNSSSLCCDNILNFVQDNRGRLWLGTEKGLDRLNESGKDFSHFLPGVQILNILSDDNNCLWIGTFLMGLVRFDIVSEKITYYFNNFAPQHNFAGPITKDNSGNLWLSSMGGLTCFDPNTKQYTYYHKQHGLPTVNLLLQGTKASDGKIWVGSADNGAIVFRPEELVLNQIPPPIRIVDFRVSDKSLTIGEDSPLKCNISLADEIHLEYWQNDISIECAALHYSRPEKNQYTFWLENYDESWREAGTNRFSIYTNLDPGTYIFRAKAANSDGVWNPNPVSLQIIISPPWWRTGWAYFLWIGLFSGAVYSAYRLQLNRARLKQEVSLKIEQAQKLHELDRLKSSFFANISHELRTPLTLILGPLDSLRHETISDNIKKKLDIMQRNGIRLLQLINQLLDFSKVEAGSIRLEAAEMDLVAFVKRIVATFMSAAERKNISLEFRAEDRALLCYFDADKMDKVLANLLSNAFKFTPEYGRIDVFIHKEEPRVFIVVKDTGIGIPEDQLDHIFDRFHQVDGSHTRKAEGAGIGLALAKEMVELHHGDIYAASQPGEGSEFTVQLFLGRAHLKEEEIVKSPVNESIFAPTLIELAAAETTQEVDRRHGRADVLVIEDNSDVRFYIRDLLSNDYNIREAQNGQEGFAIAAEKTPDLIVSDVMMPEMDGYEMCQKLKTDERTSHIPVILLTARADEADKLTGLETGADDYIIKPFSAPELRARVRNLIEQRKKLRAKFSSKLDVDPSEVTVTSMDRQFLKRAIDIVEEHLEHPDFSIEVLAQKIGYSRMHLFRKIKALTDLSVSQFVLVIRLKRAAQLLEERSATVTEIAYQVGFENPSYFSACFRRQFGVSPSEYLAS